MAELFDPYHKWLGIPPEEQPPHHYRLLAVRLFETDAEVIEAAAEQRMAHVRHQQAGPYQAQSQQLLNELAAARVCLLVPEKKQGYDLALQARFNGTARVALPMQPPPLPAQVPRAVPVATPVNSLDAAVPLEFVGENEAHLAMTRRRSGGERSPVATLIGVASIALAVMAVAFFVQTARSRQHVAAKTGESSEPAPAATIGASLDKQSNDELPPFPEIKPHPVTLPDPEPAATTSFRDWVREMRKSRVSTEAATPTPASPRPEVKPAVPNPPPSSSAASVPVEEPATEQANPGSESRSLIDRIADAVRERKLERTISAGGVDGRSPFVDVPSTGALLAGFHVTVADGAILTSIKPLFINPRGAGVAQGTRWGTERGREITLIARRGFAVSAVRVQGDSSIQGLELQFARITRTGLDPDDTYASPWVGTRSNAPPLTLGGDGPPVVGVFGRAGATLFSLGLVQLPAE